MPRTSIPRTLTELETLAGSITPAVKADVPQIARSHVKLQGLLEEVKKLLARRDDYQAPRTRCPDEVPVDSSGFVRIRPDRAVAAFLKLSKWTDATTLELKPGRGFQDLARFPVLSGV